MKTNAFPTASGRYFVESYGNGWAYTITDQETGADFFVQDDSAAQLQKDTNDFENESVIADYMDTLGE